MLQSQENESIQLGTVLKKSFFAVEKCAVHIGDYYVPQGGASDSTNLIILNVSSLWTQSSETGTEYTLQRQCLNLMSELFPLYSVFTR